jgi:spore photoproduct lyase
VDAEKNLDAVFVEDGCADSALATRVLRALPPDVPVTHVADAREAARPISGALDPFGAGKRRLVIARRKTPFLMPCPAGSSKFACCGYLVLTLASNCPMDCSYCFLQEYLADNPAFQLYANYTDSFDELDRLAENARGRSFRVGTGELADSLAFDSMTAISRDLVNFFSSRENSRPRPTKSKIFSASIRAAASLSHGRCRPTTSIEARSI